MKKVICLAFAIGIFVISCKKDNNTNGNNINSSISISDKIKLISENYRASMIKELYQFSNVPYEGEEDPPPPPEPPKLEEKSPEADRVIAADVVGGLAGGMLGPLGAFLGALAASSYDITQQINLVIPVGNSDTKDSNGNNPLNQFDYYGSSHNDFVKNFCLNYTGIAYDMTNYYELNNDVMTMYPSVFGELNYSDSLALVTYNYITHYENTISNVVYSENYFNDIFDNAFNMEYITEVEKNVMSIYLNELTSLAYQYNITTANNFSYLCENEIANSEELNEQSKTKLLIAMAIARSSNALYYGL